MAEHHLVTPFTGPDLERLRAGDVVYVTGLVYSCRSAVRRRLDKALKAGADLPFDPRGAVVYTTDLPPDLAWDSPSWARPSPGSGPGAQTPGGAGCGGAELGTALPAVSFGVPRGADVQLGLHIRRSTEIAEESLGPDVLRELVVENFPVLVTNDCHGGGFRVSPSLETLLC